MDKPLFKGWAVLELMGHRRLGGYVTEEEHFGVPLLRIDIPGPGDSTITQFYSASALYALTPSTEEAAKAVAAYNQPRPIARFELSSPRVVDDDDPPF